MADAGALEEFYVALTYKLDESSRRHADQALEGTKALVQGLQATFDNLQKSLAQNTQAVTQVSDAFTKFAGEPMRRPQNALDSLIKGVKEWSRQLTLTVGAFVAGMRVVAREYDQLAYVAQRTGASAANLKGIGEALRQTGGQAGEAAAAIDHMNTQFRRYPGMAEQFQRQTSAAMEEERQAWAARGANFDALDEKTKNYYAGIRAISNAPDWQQGILGGQWFGLSDQQTQDRINNSDRMRDAHIRYQDSLKAAGLTEEEVRKTTEKARDLTADWSGLMGEVGILMTKAFRDVEPILTPIVKGLRGAVEWLNKMTTAVPGSSAALVFLASAGGVGVLLKALGSGEGGLLGTIGKIVGRTGLGAIEAGVKKLTGIDISPLTKGLGGFLDKCKDPCKGLADGLKEAGEKSDGLIGKLKDLNKEATALGGGLQMAVKGIQPAIMAYQAAQEMKEWTPKDFAAAQQLALAPETSPAGRLKSGIFGEGAGKYSLLQNLGLVSKEETDKLTEADLEAHKQKVDEAYEKSGLATKIALALPRMLAGQLPWKSPFGTSEKAATETEARAEIPAAGLQIPSAARQAPQLGAFEQAMQMRLPRFQQGGIVTGQLHQGEMVLPKRISEGLQRLFRSGDKPFDEAKLAQSLLKQLVPLLIGGPVGAQLKLLMRVVPELSKAIERYDRLGQQEVKRQAEERFNQSVVGRAVAPLHGLLEGARGALPSFQQGGVVTGQLHQGEMVLPPALSRGLQDLVRSGTQGGEESRSMARRFGDWLRGSAAPKVLIDNIKDFAREFVQQFALEQKRQKGELGEPAQPATTPEGEASAVTGAAAGPTPAGAPAATAVAPAVAEGRMPALQGAPRMDIAEPWGGGGPTGYAGVRQPTPGGRAGRAAGAAAAQAAGAVGEAVSGARRVIGAAARGSEYADAPGRGTPADISADLMQRFQSELGLTREQAAGLVGNLAHESGGFKLFNERGGPGVGYAQWTTPDRKAAFEAYAQERGLDVRSHEANAGFVVRELQTTHKNVLANLRKAETTEAAAKLIHEKYETPLDVLPAGGRTYKSAPERLRYAQAAVAGEEQRAQQLVSASYPGGVLDMPPGGVPVTQTEMGPVVGEGSRVIQQQRGTRREPIAPELEAQLNTAAAKVGVKARVFSGGEPKTGPKGSQSGRHDYGAAADLELIDEKTGRVLNMTKPEDQARIKEFMKSSVAAGATGIGMGEGYMGPTRMHIGGGESVYWGGGKGGTSARGAPAFVREAHAEGTALRKEAIKRGENPLLAATGQPTAPAPAAAALPEVPSFAGAFTAQRGGIVPNIFQGIAPLLAHAGEMVLPELLSQGLQRLVSGNALQGLERIGTTRLGGDNINNFGGNRNVTFNQTNNSNFGDATSPATAARFRDQHERVYGDLVRNFRTVIA